jgi:hypothetical protein
MTNTAALRGLLLALAVLLCGAAGLDAQGRGGGRGQVTEDGLVVLPAQAERGRGQAPAYCRSGAGHPTAGRQWCLAKGFGLGRDRGTWGTARMGEIVFRTRQRESGRELGRAALEQAIGPAVLARLEARSRILGAREPLTGRWLPTGDGGHTLFIRSGVVPVAELVDRTGNGRVDLVLLNMRG